MMLKNEPTIIYPKPFNIVSTNKFPDIPTEHNDIGRFYLTPYGRFPSVTTVLSIEEKEEITQWRKAVGEDEANKISKLAQRYGETFHGYLEKYLNNETFILENDFLTQNSVLKTIRILNDSVENIIASEACLYSKYLHVAGRVDLIADFMKKRSIIDFKRVKNLRNEHEIKNYFMQTSAYSVMYEELTGVPIEQLVIIMSVELEEPKIFVKNRDDYIFDFIKIKNDFYKHLLED